MEKEHSTDCNSEQVICKLVIWFITGQRKMQLDEYRNCVLIIRNFFAFNFMCILVVFVFSFFGSSEISPPLKNTESELFLVTWESWRSIRMITVFPFLFSKDVNQPLFIISGLGFVTLIFIDKMIMHLGFFFQGVKWLPKQTILRKSYIQT